MLSQDLINAEFPLDPSLIYLNHAAVSPWPARTQSAVTRFANENTHFGATNYLEWLKIEENLKLQLSRLINAPCANDIALLKNTSEALSFVAAGLKWHSGDNIVISNQEFPSNKIVWQQLQHQGVELREVDLNKDSSPEAALISAIDNKTRLLSISSVQYASGLRTNLNQLGDFCRKRQVLFCVDAIQSLGALEFDVDAIQADFVMADTHKWMLGPEGIALFYCREEIREQLELTEFGWHMVEDMHNFTQESWQVASSARRFECGSPNMLGIHAANASISLLLEVGLAKIESAILERAQFTVDCIKATENLELISSTDPRHLSGIVTFRSTKVASESLYQSLMKNKVICANRGGGIRFSPHFYTSKDLINDAVQLSNQSD
ncbi:Cysteine desulfurase [hydrothermal vent metagenome]|uniref:Cysteine desulfurase n=1 Tax=hydrothermal vent metagenome TaxID=652676 RepID=A0A3B0ZTM1_9ZZZZ